jgi:hypothetical protein
MLGTDWRLILQNSFFGRWKTGKIELEKLKRRSQNTIAPNEDIVSRPGE